MEAEREKEKGVTKVKRVKTREEKRCEMRWTDNATLSQGERE